MPTCEHEDGCTLEGFSKSIEHGNLWFCPRHYKNWLPQREMLTALSAIQKLSKEQKAALKEALT